MFQYLGRLDAHTDSNLERRSSSSKSCASRRPRTKKAEARRDARGVEHLVVNGHLVFSEQAFLQRGSEAVKAKVDDKREQAPEQDVSRLLCLLGAHIPRQQEYGGAAGDGNRQDVVGRLVGALAHQAGAQHDGYHLAALGNSLDGEGYIFKRLILHCGRDHVGH